MTTVVHSSPLKTSASAAVSVRQMRERDLEFAVEIHAERFADSRGTHLGAHFLKAMYRWFMGHFPTLTLVAELDGRVVGCAAGAMGGYGRPLLRAALTQSFWGVVRHPRNLVRLGVFHDAPSLLLRLDPRMRIARRRKQGGPRTRASLAAVAVDSRYEGMGAGKALVAAFEEEAMSLGCTELRLRVEMENSVARHLLERLGWSLGEPPRTLAAYGKVLNPFLCERARIRTAYEERKKRFPVGYYSSEKVANRFQRSSRVGSARYALERAGLTPLAGKRVLEVGFGPWGWFQDLLDWGAEERNLAGIELDPAHVTAASERYPAGDFKAGDAAGLPWDAGSFDLVIASTMFSSILPFEVRAKVAEEITRVLRPGGHLLWYDFRYRSLLNSNVREVTRRELSLLYPRWGGEVQSVTLLPPLARAVAPISWKVATFLEKIPPLRSHLVAVLRRPT